MFKKFGKKGNKNVGKRAQAYKDHDWDAVIKYGEMDLDRDPGDIRTHNDLAYAYYHKKNYDRAMELCEHIYELEPAVDVTVQVKTIGAQNMRYHEILGEMYYLKGRDEEALKILEPLKALDKVFAKKYSVTAKIYIRREDFAAAAREYALMAVKCPRHSDEATAGLSDIIDLDPLSEAPYQELFRTYSDSGQLESVVSTHEAMRKTGKIPDKSLYTLVNFHHLSGKHEEALSVLQEEAAKHPDDATLQVFLARTFQAMNEFVRVEECMKKAMVLNPQLESRFQAIQVMLEADRKESENRLKEQIDTELKNKRCDEAIRACEQFLKINPQGGEQEGLLIEVMDKCVAIYIDDSNIEEAVALLKRLEGFQDADPEISEQIQNRYNQISRQRVEIYERIIAEGKVSEGELNRTRLELANLYLERREDSERALPLFKELIAAGGPEANDACYNIAVCLLEAEKLDEAEEHVRVFAAIPCSDDRIKSQMYDLGVACKEAQLKHQARSLFGNIAAVDRSYRELGKHMADLQRPTAGKETTEAIMVMDICESSRMMDLYGDEVTNQMKNSLEARLFPIFKDLRSTFTKSTGDGFLVTFPSAALSVAASIKALVSTSEYNDRLEEGKPKVHLRFGVHFGAVRIRGDGDRHGTNINIPFRVEGLKGENMVEVEEGVTKQEVPTRDRILVTEAVAQQVSEEFDIKYLGLFELRNISGMHKIYECKTEYATL